MDSNTSIFACINKFNNECDEDILVLLKLAKQDDDHIQLFISSAIVLLGAKFESCVESLIIEYIDIINNNKYKDLIPNSLKYSSIYNKLSSFKEKINTKNYNCFAESDEYLDDFSEFVEGIMNNSNELSVNNKFNYGNHGLKDLIKLFKNIEIDIEEAKYNKFSIPQLLDNFSEDVSFKDKYNEFVNYRNRVAHQNENPNITSDDVGKIVNIFKKFIKEIDKELTQRLKEMKAI